MNEMESDALVRRKGQDSYGLFNSTTDVIMEYVNEQHEKHYT